jgi:hypothetical protein
MKKYYLTILYLTGNLKSEEVEISAAHLSVTNGALVFYDRSNEVSAVYPVNCTIITKIIETSR